MLTFEEFFAKKKIDLQALENDNKELYEEFFVHYHAMGEKSFDHTKKFWFNRLRKSYRLNEAELEQKQSIAKVEKPVITSEAPSKLGFRPKFKSKSTEEIPPSDPKTEQPAEDTPVANKPAGFKPRFKAGVTKAAEPAKEESPTEQPAEDTPVANKPAGFKPRFKAGVTKVKKEDGNADN